MLENTHTMSSTQTATDNFERHLAGNSYPGRGIVLGRSTKNTWIQIYWIMGRSDNSRNRVLVEENGTLRTEAADPEKMDDPSLVIYTAMHRVKEQYIVTNGAQTDALFACLLQEGEFVDSLLPWSHEPDAPNFTPRISGCTDISEGSNWLSIIKANSSDGRSSEHHFFHYADIPEGFGYAITTYQGDGKPIPPYEGTPLLMPLQGDGEAIARTYWDALDRDNRIGLAVRTIEVDGSATIDVTNKLQRQ
jgi:IMP cyclohydrolase